MIPNCTIKQAIPVIAYLALLLAFALLLEMPVKSIFPYASPVVIASARCGWRAGFVMSVISTGVAWFGGAFPTVPENAGLEFDEVLITLTELVLAAVIASAVARKLSGVSKERLFD